MQRRDQKHHRNDGHQQKTQIVADKARDRNGDDQKPAEQELLVAAEQQLLLHAER